jgi:hypothetical protein
MVAMSGKTKIVSGKVAELDVDGYVRVEKYDDRFARTSAWFATNDSGVDLQVGDTVTLLIDVFDVLSTPSIGARVKSVR